jgi:hypothetical protein
MIQISEIDLKIEFYKWQPVLFTGTASVQTGGGGNAVTNYGKINFIDTGGGRNFVTDSLTFDNIDITNIRNTKNNMLPNFLLQGTANPNGNNAFHRIVERYITMFILAYIDSAIVTPEQVDLAESEIKTNLTNIYAANAGNTIQYPGDDNRIIAVGGNNNIKYQKFIDHLENKKGFRYLKCKKCASWLYSLICISLCIENHSSNWDSANTRYNMTKEYHNHEHTHLQGLISQTVLYLISAFANYQTDMTLSISQACKINLIDQIINNNGFESGGSGNVTNSIANTYSCWIYTLLSDKSNYEIIDNITNNREPTEDSDLVKIYHLTRAYFTNKSLSSPPDIDIDVEDIYKLTNISPSDQNKYAFCEILITAIMRYYDNMPQKPLLQHVVDTVALIRYYYISSHSNDLYNYKLKTLFIKPNNQNMDIDFRNLHTRADMENFNGSLLGSSNSGTNSKFKVDPDFTTIFGENDYTKQLNYLTEFQIPSKINFYLEVSDSDLKTHYGVSKKTVENNLRYNKLVEANYLGLNYIGKLFELNTKQRNDNDEMELFNYSNVQVDVATTNASNNNIFNLSINNITPHETSFGSPNLVGNPTTFKFTPSTTECYNFSLYKMINHLVELENRVTTLLKQYFKNFSSNGVSKTYQNIVTYLYPILNALFEHKKYILSLVSEEEIRKITNMLDQFNRNKFEDSINKINSYLYLFYYLSSTGTLQIPTFLYYQFDMTPNPLLIFSQSPPDIVYPSDKNDVSPATSPPTIMTPYLDSSDNDNDRVASGSIYNIPISNYNSIRELISNRTFFKVRKIIKEAFVMSKDEKLPPSIKPFLNLFYKLTTLEFIKNKLETVSTLRLTDEEKKNLFATDNQAIKNLNEAFTIAKIMEDIIKLYVNNVIYSIGFNLFNEKVLQNRTDLGTNPEYLKLLFDPVPFEVELNQTINDDVVNSINSILTTGDEESLFNYYQFSEFKDMDKLEEKKKDKFIIYPNDYNRTNLIKSRLCIEINRDLLNELLVNSAYGAGDINSQNNDNSSPLLFLLKFYNYDIINYINYKISSLDNSKLTDEVSMRYIKTEYRNNIDKFINQKDGITDQIKAFTYGNYREIESIILSNDEFNRNVLKNLELSFVICNYLTQQYFGLSLVYSGIKEKVNTLLSKNMDGKKLSNVFEGNTVASYFLEKADSSSSKRALYYELEDKKKFLTKKIDKYKLKKAKYTRAQTELSSGNSELLDEKLKVIDDKLLKYEDELNKINGLLASGNFDINIVRATFNKENFLDLYQEFINSHDRQSYMRIWKNLLKNNNITQDNPEIIISQMLNMENKDGSNKEGLIDLYEHFNMMGEEYFEEDKYLDKAPHHKFVRLLLHHLIQNVICVGIETLIRRILYNYFRTNKEDFNLYLSPGGIETEEEKINSYIEYILGNKIVDSTGSPQTDLSIKVILYQIVSKQMLLYSTRLFNNIEEENKYKEDDNNDIEEILNTFIDTLSELSPIKLNDEVISIFKRYIVSYFSSISFTLIKNWHITIENIFVYCINHYRILKCIDLISP